MGVRELRQNLSRYLERVKAPRGDLIASLGPRLSVDGPSTADVLAKQREERL